MRQYVIQCLHEDKYDQLKNELRERYGLKSSAISQFFLKEGSTLLRWALTTATSDKPLNFLIEVVPTETLQKILSDKDFSVLKSFLYLQVGLQGQSGYFTKEMEAIIIKKFEALLRIDSSAIIGFMYDPENNDNYLQTQKIKENFETALATIKSPEINKSDFLH